MTAMRIVYFSDVHIEIRESQPAAPWSDTLPLGFGPELSTFVGAADLLILAGDIGRVHSTRNVSPLSYAREAADFLGCGVVLVPGKPRILSRLLSRGSRRIARRGRSDGDGARQGRGMDRTRRRRCGFSRRRCGRITRSPHQGRRARTSLCSAVGPRTAPRAPFHRSRDRARYRYYENSRSGPAVTACQHYFENGSFSQDVMRQSSRAVLRQRSNGVRSCLRG